MACLPILPVFAGHSFRLPTEGWLGLSIPGTAPRWFTTAKIFTNPDTNRAWRRVTTLIEINTAKPNQQQTYRPIARLTNLNIRTLITGLYELC